MKLIGVNDAAERLGVSSRRVRSLITEGKLDAIYVGGGYVMEESALRSVTVYGKAGRPPKAEKEATAKANGKKARTQ